MKTLLSIILIVNILLFGASNSKDSSDTKITPQKKIIWEPPEWTNHQQKDPNISYADRSDKHKRIVRRIEKKMSENEIIDFPGISDLLLWGLEDDLTRIYYSKVMLERGNIVTKIDVFPITRYLNKFSKQYPIVYTDLNGEDHVITEKWFITHIKSLLIIDDPSLQLKSCAELIKLNYIDEQIFSILKKYSKGTDFETWNVVNNLGFRCGYSDKVKRDKSYANLEIKELEELKSRNSLRLLSVTTLISITNYSYKKEIDELLNDLLKAETNKRIRDRIDNYLQNDK